MLAPAASSVASAELGLGWTLAAYEANLDQKPSDLGSLSNEETNRRKNEQARNLARVMGTLSDTARLLFWCGNHHLAKRPSHWWQPMGSRLRELTGIDPFAIDQTPTAQTRALARSSGLTVVVVRAALCPKRSRPARGADVSSRP